MEERVLMRPGRAFLLGVGLSVAGFLVRDLLRHERCTRCGTASRHTSFQHCSRCHAEFCRRCMTSALDVESLPQLVEQLVPTCIDCAEHTGRSAEKLRGRLRDAHEHWQEIALYPDHFDDDAPTPGLNRGGPAQLLIATSWYSTRDLAQRELMFIARFHGFEFVREFRFQKHEGSSGPLWRAFGRALVSASYGPPPKPGIHF